MAVKSSFYETSDEIPLKELMLSIQHWVRYLLGHWRLLLIIVIVGSSLGLLYAFTRTPQYTATTTFVLEGGGESRGGLSRYAGVAALAGIDLGGSAGGLFQGNNILELYKSRRMLTQTVLSKVDPDSEELLIERYIEFNKLREEWKKDRPGYLTVDLKQNPTSLDSQALRLRNGLINSVIRGINKENLLVDRLDKDLSIIKVDVVSPDEVFSKVFNEVLVSRVNDFYIQSKTKKSTEAIAILEHKVDSVRAEMTGAISAVAQVSDATPNLNPTRQAQRVVPTQEAQVSVEANKAMLAQLVQNLELTKMNQLQEQPLIQIIDQPVYPLTVQRSSKVKGAVFGAVLFGFLTVLFLVVRRWYRDVMAGD